MSYKTIKISEKNYDKIMDIKDLQGLKSANQVMDTILPKGTVNNTDFVQEQCAFKLNSISITWDDLKMADINTSWNDGIDSATVIFKDDFGVLVRFISSEDIFIEYYNFL